MISRVFFLNTFAYLFLNSKFRQYAKKKKKFSKNIPQQNIYRPTIRSNEYFVSNSCLKISSTFE